MRAVVKIPADYLAPAELLPVAPDDVATAFEEANPGLPHSAIAVACDATRLTEVRLSAWRRTSPPTTVPA